MRTLSITFGLAIGWACLAGLGTLEPLERLTAQARYLLRPAGRMQAPVTIVAIDEQALRRYGQMPWDRQVFARLIDKLADAGARVVGVDVAFSEPARDPVQDEALARAIARVPTVLPTFLAYVDAAHTTEAAIDPLPGLAAAAAALGSVQLSSRPQAQVWEIEPYQQAASRLVPAFPVAMVGIYQGRAWRPPATGFPWRAEPRLLDFKGPANTAPQVSAADVLAGAVPADRLAGRLVLVGATAAGLPDTNFAVPDFRGGPMAGVELSANAIADMLEGGFQRRTSVPALALLLGVLAWVPGRRLGSGSAPSAQRVPLALGVGAAWLALACLAFRWRIWLDVVPVIGLVGSCFLLGLLAERTYLLESKNQLLARYAQDLAEEARRQRTRIEGELHDGLQQLMVVALREARQALKLDPTPGVASHLAFLADLATDAHDEVLRLRADLLPPALRDAGLPEALHELAGDLRGRGLAVTVEEDGWTPPARELEVELYWLVKEALNNVEKHAEASEVRIRLASGRGEALVEVADNGRGFTPPDPSVAPAGLAHSGLHRMWLRARGNRGNLEIASTPGHGTRLRLAMPVEAGRSNA